MVLLFLLIYLIISLFKMTVVPRFRIFFPPTMESNEKLAAVIFAAIDLEKGNNSGILEVLCNTASSSENGQSPVTPDPQLRCKALLEFKLIHFLSPVHLTNCFRHERTVAGLKGGQALHRLFYEPYRKLLKL